MGTELRINTTGWSRELTEATKSALRGLDPGGDPLIYETAADGAGMEINLEELQEIYEELLPETAELLGADRQGYEFLPWERLGNRDIAELAGCMRCETDPDPQLPPISPSGAGSAEEFIAVYGRWMAGP